MSIDVAIPGDRNVIKKESEDILKYKNLITEIQRMWNMKAKVITVIRGDWNHFIITQTISEQHTGKARGKGTTKKQPYWALHIYCESANVQAQNISRAI